MLTGCSVITLEMRAHWEATVFPSSSQVVTLHSKAKTWLFFRTLKGSNIEVWWSHFHRIQRTFAWSLQELQIHSGLAYWCPLVATKLATLDLFYPNYLVRVFRIIRVSHRRIPRLLNRFWRISPCLSLQYLRMPAKWPTCSHTDPLLPQWYLMFLFLLRNLSQKSYSSTQVYRRDCLQNPIHLLYKYQFILSHISCQESRLAFLWNQVQT